MILGILCLLISLEAVYAFTSSALGESIIVGIRIVFSQIESAAEYETPSQNINPQPEVSNQKASDQQRASTHLDAPPVATSDDIKDSNAATADASFVGEYEMLSESEDMGASLSISVIHGREIYVVGFANYQDHVGEVSGEAQVVDAYHLAVSEDDSRLDIFYDVSTDTLTVEEAGSFGGMGVTFGGIYVKADKALDMGNESYQYLEEFAYLVYSDPSAMESEDENEYNAFIQAAKEDYERWVAGTDFDYIIIDSTGHLAIDYDVAEAEGIVGLW